MADEQDSPLRVGFCLSYVEHIRLKEVSLSSFLNDFVIFLEGVCLLPFGLFLRDGMGCLVVREGAPVVVDEPP